MQDLENLDLSKTIFTRRGVRPLLVLKGGELYLGLRPAPSALPFENMFGGNEPLGIMKITVMDGESEIPYAISCGAFVTELRTDAGVVRFAPDRDANAMRLEGDVPLLRLSGETVRGANSIALPDGAETGRGGRIVYKVARGSFTYDDTWIQAKYSNVAPCLDVRSDGGKLEMACIEVAPDIDPPKLTKTFDECVSENKADFEAFRKTLLPTDGLTAYELWAASPKTGSIDLAGESWLFSDPLAVAERVLASAEAGKTTVIPKFAAAALRLIEGKMIASIPEETAGRLKAALQESLNWWKEYRYDAHRGQYFFAYRSETGEENPQWFGKAPVYSPELQERLSELSVAVAKLS